MARVLALASRRMNVCVSNRENVCVVALSVGFIIRAIEPRGKRTLSLAPLALPTTSKSRTKMFVETLAPGSRHTRVVADSKAKPRPTLLPSNNLHGPRQTSGRPHRQEWEDRGRGRLSRRKRSTLKRSGSKRLRRAGEHCRVRESRQRATLRTKQCRLSGSAPRQQRTSHKKNWSVRRRVMLPPFGRDANDSGRRSAMACG